MTKQTFKAIFFDYDGLLVDTESLLLEATQEIFAPLGITITKEWYIRENLGRGRSSFDFAREGGLDETAIVKLRAERESIYIKLLTARAQVFEGVPEVLASLRGNYVIGIVTSSTRAVFDTTIRKLGLRDLFDFFVTGDDVECLKPNPEPYLRAIALSKEVPAACLALEDSLRGVQSAKAAGLVCFAIPDEMTRTQDFSVADRVLTNIQALPGLLMSADWTTSDMLR